MDTATATAQLESFNPATGEPLGAVPITAPEDVQGVVDAVAAVQPAWAQLTLAERGSYLERAAQVLLDESDDIRDLIVREQGKPRNEAFSMELLPTIDALGWIAKAGVEILADEKIPMPQLFLKTKRSAFTYEPLGVIGVISPWNYPWSIPFGEVALALMAGNGVVLKPASLTPLIGDRIARIFERAGVPRVWCGSCTVRGPARRWPSRASGRCSSRARCETGRSVAESLRPASEGVRARARRQGPDDRARAMRIWSMRSPERCGAGSPTRARRARGSSACTSSARWRTGSSRVWSPAHSGCGWAIR